MWKMAVNAYYHLFIHRTLYQYKDSETVQKKIGTERTKIDCQILSFHMTFIIRNIFRQISSEDRSLEKKKMEARNLKHLF